MALDARSTETSTRSCDSTTSKRLKLDSENVTDISQIQTFSDFKLLKVLNDDVKAKSVAVHGKFGDSEGDAVVLLEKTPFTASLLPQIFSRETTLEVDFRNDIYGQYVCQLLPHLNAVKGTIMYPATAKHLDKFTAQDLFIVHESPDDYESVTLPFIKEQSFSLQWVYNILEKKAEVERVIFEDTNPVSGFVLLPDLKWDQKQMENLYLVAICQSCDVKSMRSLDASHLPLLKNILKKGQEAIKDKYGMSSDQLRVYVHYQPSYYHFHVHFTHLKFDAPGCATGKAHLLQDIIDNIENIDSKYYQKKTLSCVFKQNDKLFKRFQNMAHDKSD